MQVGANDGVYGEPLRSCVRRFGWKGILVESRPDVYARIVENYRDSAEHLIFENIAISPDAAQVTRRCARASRCPSADPRFLDYPSWVFLIWFAADRL